MEGTVDSPKSLLSNNLVKLLTATQTVPLVCVDVLEHPAIMGYTVHRSGSHCTPHVYVNGTFFGDYDMVMSKYKSGELKKLASKADQQSLPVGMF
jgi:glutaredoxin-related protein